MTTSLLVTTITTASSLYVAYSSPSPHHPSSASTSSTRTGPPPPPPRALVFLTSESTRKGLASVHAVSGEAVKISSKTVNRIDGMIRRAMGARPKRRERQDLSSTPASIGYLSPAGSPPPLPPRTPSPSGSTSRSALPSYDSVVNGTKPPLPSRTRSPSPNPIVPPPLPSTAAPPQLKLTTKDRVLISADLILSTIDNSARRVLDTGAQEIGKVVGHKYGPEAAHSSLLMAGTARNVGLVYVDVKGVGRRALLRRAGRTFVKGQMSDVAGKSGKESGASGLPPK